MAAQLWGTISTGGWEAAAAAAAAARSCSGVFTGRSERVVRLSEASGLVTCLWTVPTRALCNDNFSHIPPYPYPFLAPFPVLHSAVVGVEQC